MPRKAHADRHHQPRRHGRVDTDSSSSSSSDDSGSDNESTNPKKHHHHRDEHSEEKHHHQKFTTTAGLRMKLNTFSGDPYGGKRDDFHYHTVPLKDKRGQTKYWNIVHEGQGRDHKDEPPGHQFHHLNNAPIVLPPFLVKAVEAAPVAAAAPPSAPPPAEQAPTTSTDAPNAAPPSYDQMLRNEGRDGVLVNASSNSASLQAEQQRAALNQSLLAPEQSTDQRPSRSGGPGCCVML